MQKSVLNYPRDYYTVSSLELADVLTNKEMRVEYSRLRSIAQKRLANLRRAGYTDDNFYRYNAERYVPLADIKNEKQLMQKLSDIANFLSSRKSIVRERRKKEADILERLHKNGLDFVNEDNLQRFGEFMEAFRQEKIDSLYSSDQAADLFDIAIEKRISFNALQKNFEEFLGQEEKISKIKRRKSSKPMSASELRRRLKNADKKDNKGRGSGGRSATTGRRNRNSKKGGRKPRNQTED